VAFSLVYYISTTLHSAPKQLEKLQQPWRQLGYFFFGFLINVGSHEAGEQLHYKRQELLWLQLLSNFFFPNRK
jgi:hypothetical protein